MHDENPQNQDPITHEPGAHPVGAGVGAAGGAAAGAAIGAVAGPIGAAVGAVAGAVVGGLAGKDAAEVLNPTLSGFDLAGEETYWRGTYANRSGYVSGYTYDDDYGPAYRLGYEGRIRYAGAYEASQSALQAEWEQIKGQSRLSWEQAQVAVRDAWQRVDLALAEVGDNR